MSITTQRFVRKPYHVDAVQVTGANMEELASWCGGEVKSFEPPVTEGQEPRTVYYVAVPVIRPQKIRQTQAFANDWILRAFNGSFKVYTPKAFKAEFVTEPVKG